MPGVGNLRGARGVHKHGPKLGRDVPSIYNKHASMRLRQIRQWRVGSARSVISTRLPSPSDSPTPMSIPGVRSTGRNMSPIKRTRVDDEVLPERSILVESHPLTLEDRSTFSPPTSQASKVRRSSSPSRETEANLRFANPPIRTEPLNGVKDPIPQRVRDIMDRLEPDNVERWVPASLKESIMTDPELGLQQVSKRAWNSDNNDLAINQKTLEAVKDIFLCARHCTENGRDENAWCAEVVRPLLELALSLSDTKNLMVQSVYVVPTHLSNLEECIDSAFCQPIPNRQPRIHTHCCL
jgi:hypothetical protein